MYHVCEKKKGWEGKKDNITPTHTKTQTHFLKIWQYLKMANASLINTFSSKYQVKYQAKDRNC